MYSLPPLYLVDCQTSIRDNDTNMPYWSTSSGQLRMALAILPGMPGSLASSTTGNIYAIKTATRTSVQDDR